MRLTVQDFMDNPALTSYHQMYEQDNSTVFVYAHLRPETEALLSQATNIVRGARKFLSAPEIQFKGGLTYDQDIHL